MSERRLPASSSDERTLAIDSSTVWPLGKWTELSVIWLISRPSDQDAGLVRSGTAPGAARAESGPPAGPRRRQGSDRTRQARCTAYGHPRRRDPQCATSAPASSLRTPGQASGYGFAALMIPARV